MSLHHCGSRRGLEVAHFCFELRDTMFQFQNTFYACQIQALVCQFLDSAQRAMSISLYLRLPPGVRAPVNPCVHKFEEFGRAHRQVQLRPKLRKQRELVWR